MQRGAEAELVLGELAGALSAPALARLRAGLLRVPPHPAAATDLRSILARGEDPGELLPGGIAAYALAPGLYRPPSR